MSLLYRILYAAHANGTHHKLALKGIAQMQGANADAWRQVFLSEASALLEGSKAPDKSFKDFQNHCLHISEDPAKADWGGAERAAAEWYQETVAALSRRDWSAAAYAAGVMSHYYTDPLMPFHTGSSEQENIVHRAVEWSASKSFEQLWAAAAPAPQPAISGLSEVGAFVRAGAVASRKHYWTLIEDYDFPTGVKAPEKGLGSKARRAISQLLAHAAAGCARLFERACADSGAVPPNVDLTVPTVVAGLNIPAKWVLNRLEDVADRREVARIFKEFSATGRVEETLPEENRAVRALCGRLAGADVAALRRAADRPESDTASAPENPAAPRARGLREVDAEAPKQVKSKKAPKKTSRSVGASNKAVAPRANLASDAPVARAPSIGPKTAAKLDPLGVLTVGDLVKSDPQKIADGLSDSRITVKTVMVWRDQARLLMRVPGLKAAYAVMLVAGGYRDVTAVAAADPARLTDELARAAKTDKVKRALRNAAPPNRGEAVEIVTRAQLALADA